MKQLKYIAISLFTVLIFIRCTEIYNPTIDPTSQALVVQGLITDGSGPFSVKLATALIYSSDPNARSFYVFGAKLNIVDNEKNTFNFTEGDYGVYTLPTSFRAKIGNSYKLHIETTDGNIYESDYQRLMPPQTYDSIRSPLTENTFVNNMNDLAPVKGVNILVQLFKSVTDVDSLPLCRFDANMTIQNAYPVYIRDTIKWHWVINDWKTFPLNINENITDNNHLTSNPYLPNYLICFAPIESTTYGMGTNAVNALDTFQYLRISQYTLNESSYRFYKDVNKQLNTTFNIFDPIISQLNGNLKCINNPSKIVLGLFEVSSVSRSAFLVTKDLYIINKFNLTQVSYVDIPAYGQIKYKIEDIPEKRSFHEYDYNLPAWWYHNQ
jgi:hypothetical protein